MNTSKPDQNEDQMKHEMLAVSVMEPFPEPRTIPAKWDLSEFLSRMKNSVHSPGSDPKPVEKAPVTKPRSEDAA